MFRTADAAGIKRLYLCGITPSPADMLGSATKSLQKTALGAEKIVPWKKCARTADCIRRLKAEGYFICAVEITNNAAPYHVAECLRKNTSKLAFVVGHEVDGVPKALLLKCDAVVSIPMYGIKESLNVAVAFGIIAFEIARHRLP
jgi:tRNA G18 (ribose-2'-O)-methylase SpoU